MLLRTNLTYTGIVKNFNMIYIDSDFQFCEIPLCEVQLGEFFKI